MVINSGQFTGTGLPRKNNDIHIGTGHELDFNCGCQLELCGLIHYQQIKTQCLVHGSRNNVTMSQWHYAYDCPGFQVEYDKFMD